MECSALIDKCDPSIDPLACNALTRIMCPGENGQGKDPLGRESPLESCLFRSESRRLDEFIILSGVTSDYRNLR